MSRFMIYTAGLAWAFLLIVTLSLFTRPFDTRPYFESLDTTGVVPRHTAPVGYLTDEQNARLMRWEQTLLGMMIGNTRNATTFPVAGLPSNHRITVPGTIFMEDDVDHDRLLVTINKAGIVVAVNLG